MAKLAVVCCLVLALVIVEARIQKIGSLRPGSYILSSRSVTLASRGRQEVVGTVLSFPESSSNARRIGCIIIDHQSGSENANATIEDGGLNTYQVVLAFRSAPGGSINANVEVWSSP